MGRDAGANLSRVAQARLERVIRHVLQSSGGNDNDKDVDVEYETRWCNQNFIMVVFISLLRVARLLLRTYMCPGMCALHVASNEP